MAVPQERLRVAERSQLAPLETARISWAGVWSGFLIGLGVLMLLSTLGLAIGISTADIGPGEGSDARALGIGAAIWAGLSVLIALFLAGTIASRVSMVVDRTVAMTHGALVWVLTMLGILYLAGAGVGLGMSGVLGAVRGAGSAVSGAAGGLADLTSGDVDQILGRLNDPKTAGVVAGATGMSQEDARSALADIRVRVEAARNNPQQAVAEARKGVEQLSARATERVARVAEQAQPYASRTAWTALVVMIVALAAAVGGAVWGAGRAEERLLGPRA
jgi:ElaB/YqjD/DUF883 family membrane-anchored ribosome-binding protein